MMLATRHIWWGRPALGDIRQAHWPQGVPRCQHLAPLMVNAGLPPRMVYQGGATVWGAEAHDLGHPPLKWDPISPAQAADIAKLGLWSFEHTRFTMQSFWMRAQGDRPVGYAPDMRPAQWEAPQWPNVFTDGSVDPPAQPERAVAGFGVWAPQCCARAACRPRCPASAYVPTSAP